MVFSADNLNNVSCTINDSDPFIYNTTKVLKLLWLDKLLFKHAHNNTDGQILFHTK